MSAQDVKMAKVQWTIGGSGRGAKTCKKPLRELQINSGEVTVVDCSMLAKGDAASTLSGGTSSPPTACDQQHQLLPRGHCAQSLVAMKERVEHTREFMRHVPGMWGSQPNGGLIQRSELGDMVPMSALHYWFAGQRQVANHHLGTTRPKWAAMAFLLLCPCLLYTSPSPRDA